MHRHLSHPRRIAASLCQALASGVLLVAASTGNAQDFQPEQLKNGTNVPEGMQPLYVSDFAIGHLMDGRIYVLDGKTGRYTGLLDAGMAGQFTLSPDAREAYVASTYFSRGSHGDHTDVLEIWDTSSLRIKAEIVLPAKKAQALYYKGLLRTSSDGRYVFVQNATPATSVTVVDLSERKVLSEVPTPGCWAIYPAQSVSLRFSMLCGDGKLSTVTLAPDGKVEKRSTSGQFFDGGKDPVFVSAPQDGDTYYFISFNGNLTRANLGGDTAKIEQTASIVSEADRKQGWRPGGYQVQALHRASGTLYIAMHPHGKEGSHKAPAKEVWGISAATGKRLSRTPVSHATVLTVGESGPGTLYALDAIKNQVHAYDLGKGLREAFVSDPVGEVPVQMEAP
jgi:methylamine dehydrogenase heavy chain